MEDTEHCASRVVCDCDAIHFILYSFSFAFINKSAETDRPSSCKDDSMQACFTPVSQQGSEVVRIP